MYWIPMQDCVFDNGKLIYDLWHEEKKYQVISENVL